MGNDNTTLTRYHFSGTFEIDLQGADPADYANLFERWLKDSVEAAYEPDSVQFDLTIESTSDDLCTTE